MTCHLKLITAAHSDEPWRATQHVDVGDPQLVDYAVVARLLDCEAPCAKGYGDGDGYGCGNGFGNGGGYVGSYGDGNGYGDGDGGGFGDGDGDGDGNGDSNDNGNSSGLGNGDGDGDGAVPWSNWSGCPYYHEDAP